MTTLRIDIGEPLSQTLQAAALARGISAEELAGTWLEDRAVEADFCNSTPLSAAEIEGIKRGLDDIEAGRVLEHDFVLAELAKWRSE